MKIEPGQTWEIDLFHPEDAEGVADLFLTVYGAEYPIKDYIDPERLREENAALRIISSVARTPGGDIVGHNALFQSAPWEGVYETGAGLVHAQYRGGKGLMGSLIEHGLSKAREFGVSGVFGESVCNHVFTQKATRRLGLVSHALEVDLMPAEAYVKEKAAVGRVTSLFDFITIKPRPQRVFIPPVYKEALHYLYEGLDDERDLKEAREPLTGVRSTEVSSRYFDFAQVARIAVSVAGRDVLHRLQEQETEWMQKGAYILQIWLNLAEPWIGEVTDGLRAGGYFFGGLLPRWFDSDGMLMQKVLHRPHWEDIQLQFDRAERIRNLVYADWKEAAEA